MPPSDLPERQRQTKWAERVRSPSLGDALSLRRLLLLVVLALAILIAPPAFARESGRCANGRSSVAAMWLSIAHPGLGEYHLEGGGDWSHMPERKFWFGFIPLYGWPGYLQIKSALDAKNCLINDDLTFKE